MSNRVYAIRGAITVEENTKKEIFKATEELITEAMQRNDLSEEDVISMFFTMTQDLNAVFPARAARSMGLDLIPLLCATEIDVPDAISKCIRILIHFNSEGEREEIKHTYLRKAEGLRPDLA